MTTREDGETDSVEAVSRSFYEQGRTDGLPIVPPTDGHVDRMLEGTDRDRDELLGTLGTREGKLTVEGVAVNGVMAGCLPIHMPVLLAGAEVLVDPKANAIQASVSTGSWAYFFLLNGPIRDKLDINSDTGAFGPGYRSNRSIARAIGLIYKNSARIHPGEKEMATMGNPFKFSLLAGENQERSPWDPMHVTRGCDPGDNAITFAAPNSFLQSIPNEVSAKGVLANMIQNTPPRMRGMKNDTANERFEGIQMEVFYGLCPYNAQELADWTKAEIKAHIQGNASIPVAEFDDAVAEEAAANGQLPPIRLSQFDDTERINLFVVGGSGRFNAIIGPTLGGPVTKQITLPSNFDGLLEQYRPHLQRDWGTGWDSEPL